MRITAVITAVTIKAIHKTIFFLLLTLSINPIIYYIIWPSAEVFIYAFIVMSLVFFFNKSYKRSAFLLTIAGSMNTTIMALGIFMIIIFFIDLQKEKGDKKSILTTIYNNIPIIIKYAASFSFIFIAFIYNYIASGNFITTQSSLNVFDSGTYYLSRFIAYFFDLNFGILTWFFVIFILYIIVIGMAAFQLKYRFLLLAVGHICVVLAFSLHSHINCGMCGIARYNAWIAPVMLFVTVIYLFEVTCDIIADQGFSLHRFITKYTIIKNGVIIISVILTTFVMFLLGFRLDQNWNYMTMQRPATFILKRIPNLYNPLYSTFISRIENRDGGYDYREPVFYIDSRTNHDSEIRKILIKRNEKDSIINILAFDDENSRLYLERKIKKIPDKGSEYVYLNIPPKYKIKKKQSSVEFNRDLLFRIDSNDINYLVKGFSSPENNHVWTDQKEAEIKIPIQTTNSDLILTIKGSRLTTLQTVEFIVNNSVYGNLEDGYNEFIIKADELSNQNYLTIKLIISKPYTPKELGINNDTRTLGFSLQTIRLYESN